MDSAEPLSSILWTLTPHPGGSAAAGHVGCRGFGTILAAEFRCCRSSPVRNLVQLSVFGPVSHAFQSVLFGLYRTFFIIGWKKDAVNMALTHVFLITADHDICFNFVGCKSISPIRLGRTIL